MITIDEVPLHDRRDKKEVAKAILAVGGTVTDIVSHTGVTDATARSWKKELIAEACSTDPTELLGVTPDVFKAIAYEVEKRLPAEMAIEVAELSDGVDGLRKLEVAFHNRFHGFEPIHMHLFRHNSNTLITFLLICSLKIHHKLD